VTRSTPQGQGVSPSRRNTPQH